MEKQISDAALHIVFEAGTSKVTQVHTASVWFSCLRNARDHELYMLKLDLAKDTLWIFGRVVRRGIMRSSNPRKLNLVLRFLSACSLDPDTEWENAKIARICCA